jgi:CPA1 family monovalent cation:H+ antiporter
LASLSLGRIAKRPEGTENWRVIAASSIAGVRGAVTLAGALSIPLLMPDGSPFPDRDLAVTLAVGVILLSMLIAAVGLPLLLRGLPSDTQHGHGELKNARLAAVQSAMAAIDAGGNGDGAGPREAALLAVYRERMMWLHEEDGRQDDDAWRELHVTALHAEREAVQRLRMKDEIDDVLARQLLSELDLLEAALAHRPLRLATSAQSSDF